MGVSLAHPAQGATDWFNDVDGNWSTLEDEFVARLSSDASEVSFTGTTAETALMANATIPANALGVGTVLVPWAAGYLTIPANSTPSVTFRLRWGGITGTVLVSFTWNFASNPSAYDMPWVHDYRIVGVSTGATGSCSVQGWAGMWTSYNVSYITANTTIDTTGAVTLLWTAQPSLSTVTVRQRLMIVNQG